MTPITGIVYGIDLGTRTGVAFGRAGTTAINHAALRLKLPHEHRAVAFTNIYDELRKLFRTHPPALVVKEKMLPMAALLKVSGGSDDNMRFHAGLHAIVESLCGRYAVPWTEVQDSKVRKYFLGRAHCGDRESTKAAVIDRCHKLWLLPLSCRDDNLADACAVWDWACATYCGKAANAQSLYLFGERVMA